MQVDTWDVEVNGQGYEVSVERAENGKDIVRINGRVATKPIGPEEKSRQLDVGGAPYILRRQGADKFDFEAAVKSPAALAREIRERDDKLDALSVLARSKAPVALKGDSFFKRVPIFGWLVIAGLIGVMLYFATGPGYEKIAANRVKLVLSEMHELKDSPLAVTYWYKNKKTLDTSELSTASDSFDRWRSEKDLYRKIGDFEILDTEVVKGEATPTAIVHFKIEGKDYKVKVPKDQPISWVN